MSSAEREYYYRFPKSRSKRLKKAIKLAKTLPGFQELEDGYRVVPHPEQVEEGAFPKLLKLSEKWKGAAFFVGEAEVDKSEFLEFCRTAGLPPEEEPSESSPEEVAAAEEEPCEPSPEAVVAAEEAPCEPPPAAVALSEDETSGRPAEPARKEETRVGSAPEAPREPAVAVKAAPSKVTKVTEPPPTAKPHPTQPAPRRTEDEPEGREAGSNACCLSVVVAPAVLALMSYVVSLM